MGSPTISPERHVATPGAGDVVRFARAALRLVWETNRRLALSLLALTLAVAVLPAAATYVSKLIVDGVLGAIASGLAADRTAVVGWVVVEAVLLTVLLALRRIQELTQTLLHAEIGYGVSRSIFEKALSLELEQVEDPAVQERILLAKQHATSRPYSLVNRMFTLLQFTVSLTTFAALLWTFSPWAVLLVVGGGLPLFFAELMFSGRVFRFYTGRTPEMRERSYLESLLTGESTAAERLHFGSGPEVLRRYTELFQSLHREDRSVQRRQAFAGAALGALSSVVFFATKLWIVWTTLGGLLTLGQMTMFVGLVKQGQGAVSSLLAALGGMYDDLLYVSNLYDYLDIPESRRGGVATAGPAPGDGIRLERVSFTYPGSDRAALDGVSLHVPPGTRLGLVGVNGSGKSTLVKLITGLYRPTGGRVLLDGLDLEAWDLTALRARMGVLFQPFVRYKMTAGENIAMGAGLRELDDEKLLRAADRGLAGALIRDLPEGLATRLSRRFLDGRELSGGQWQRLALARALLRDAADIVILDEPTAAMDPAAEAEFVAAAANGSPAATTILISHRLANVREADLVVVMEAGAIAEHGTHAELIATGGIYCRLFTAQASAYVDAE